MRQDEWQARFSELLRSWFTADVRSLAAMRIGTALVLLYDILDRSTHVVRHYTDAGVIPRWAILQQPGWLAKISLHMLGGSAAFQGAMLVLAGVFAVLLLLGYRTRLATIASFVLLVSLQTRNPQIIFGGDWVLKMLLFWGMFIPWGAWLSFDRRIGSRKGRSFPAFVYSGGVAACMLQIGILYVFTAIEKDGAAWRTDYTALYFALSLDAYVGGIGPWLYKHYELLKLLTFSAFWIEGLSPLLWFMPFRTQALRMLGVILVTLLHLGIMTTMHVNFFPFINIVSLLIFVPSTVWDRVAGIRPAGAIPAAPATAPPRRVGLREELSNFVPLFLIGYLLALNLGIPKSAQSLAYLLKIQQGWGMFAPTPLRDDGWMVLSGTLRSGEQVDLLRGGAPLSWDKPDDILTLYGGTRWRKFYGNMRKEPTNADFAGYGRYLCDSWNRDHDGDAALQSVTPTYVIERNLVDYRTGPPTPQGLGRTDC